LITSFQETEKRRLAEIEKAQQQLQAVEEETAATEQRIQNYHSDIRQVSLHSFTLAISFFVLNV
jgi:cell division protein FtsB